jgi:hypothetical protein
LGEIAAFTKGMLSPEKIVAHYKNMAAHYLLEPYLSGATLLTFFVFLVFSVISHYSVFSSYEN